MNYPQFHKNITAYFRAHPKAVSFLKALDRFLTVLFYAVYPLLVVYAFVRHLDHRFSYVVIPAISFVCVSLFRHILNRSRPYQNGVVPLWHKDTVGHSFPSRHVFSSAMIGISLWQLNVPTGSLLLVLSGVEGVIRVLAGVHYPTDVAAGWIIGVLCGFMYRI